MYLKPYLIEDYHTLKMVTNLAEYYCALPILSRTLDAVFLRSPGLVDEINDNTCKIFQLATKLRNELLFRESLIWLVGDIDEPLPRGLPDHLEKLAKTVQNNVFHQGYRPRQRF